MGISLLVCVYMLQT